ncbi:DUF2931 family protein [Sphingobacterium yanglingense]|uniref:DUF2931 family protein n=1 Tax=Sphingobacterium yanglingense TaxID=1437280 RepID=A0A4R6W4V0_9SPHI|nr:DUF2931 family protein [Sphingobacterium yanglingense]TDQ73748.1 Protein of unknown function (DUF2931) [Sphingobacterium yanglingense]
MNILNKIYTALIILLLTSSIFLVYRSNQKINYRAGCFSAVPIHTRQVFFTDTRSTEYGNFYEADPNYFAWGQVDQYFDNNRIDVPDSLHIEYFSYTDSVFYNSTLSLDRTDSTWGKYVKTKEQLIFTLGIADKGIIKLWCSTPILGTQLILAEQLPAVAPKPEDLYYREPLSKAQYITEMFSLLDDSIKNNIDKQLYLKNYKDSSDYKLPEYIFN